MYFPVIFIREHKTPFCSEIINFSGNTLLVAAGNSLFRRVTESALRAMGFGETAILIAYGAHQLIHALSFSLAAGGVVMYFVYHSPQSDIEVVYPERDRG